MNTVRQEAMRPPVYVLVSDLVIGFGRSQAKSCSKIIWAWCSNLGIKFDEVFVNHIYKVEDCDVIQCFIHKMFLN